jgi:hypothetical protein
MFIIELPLFMVGQLRNQIVCHNMCAESISEFVNSGRFFLSKKNNWTLKICADNFTCSDVKGFLYPPYKCSWRNWFSRHHKTSLDLLILDQLMFGEEFGPNWKFKIAAQGFIKLDYCYVLGENDNT